MKRSMADSASKSGLNVCVLHLDLGIGGAEQLIVTLARLLQESGHRVTVFTTHHDPSHCFEETKPDGVLGSRIRVYGDWLPRQVFGKGTAFFAVIRMLFLSLIVALFYSQSCDVIVIDGVSAPIPLLKWFGLRVLFYCHFPDLLLCTERSSGLKRLYRRAMDSVEEWSTSRSDRILVNSAFTANVFAETFTTLATKCTPQILYPVIKAPSTEQLQRCDMSAIAYCKDFQHVFTSLNRFERKKKIEIAVEAMQRYKVLQAQRKDSDRAVLVVAGGFDLAVQENVDYLQELRALCDRLRLRHVYLPNGNDGRDVSECDVVFRTSISSVERTALFCASRALLYTPDREHFGIVPLEAMQAGLPVIAVNSGGPTETVKHGETGFLCSQSPEDFAQAMRTLAFDADVYQKMHIRGPAHVQEHFSEEAMRTSIDQCVRETAAL